MATQQVQSPYSTYGARSMYDTKSPWERMLTQMLMAQRLGSRGMAGFALGQILSGLLRDWKQRYDARGDMRNKWEPLTPDERAQELARIRAQNPADAAQAEAFMRERGFDFGTTPQTPAQAPAAQPQIAPAPTTTQSLLQPQATTNPIRAALNAEMPNTNWQQQQPQLLGSADDWTRELEKLRQSALMGQYERALRGGAQYAF